MKGIKTEQFKLQKQIIIDGFKASCFREFHFPASGNNGSPFPHSKCFLEVERMTAELDARKVTAILNPA